MTLVNREVLTREMRSVVAGSRELTTLQRAIDLLNPGHPRPDVTDVITAVLYSALRSHEDHTRAVLTRMNEAIARTLDDLDALRLGEAIGGRTATMRGNDLAVVAMAMDDLSTLEHHIRDLLQTDPDGSWVHGLRAEAEAAMTPSAQSIGAAAAAAARIPGNIGEALTGLRDAIHGVAPSGRSVWATARGAGGARELPEAIRTAAHNLVVLAGGDIGTAVRRALTTGGDAADDMVIAVLWAEENSRDALFEAMLRKARLPASVEVEPIGKKDLARLAEYDALFIRETTAISNHTYRFARRAQQEALTHAPD